MAGLLEYLRDGRDWYICQGIMVFVHLLASVLVVFIHAINYEVPYGRYHKPGSLLYTINSMLTLSPRTAWLIQELPSVVIPLFCLLNVGGDQVGEFNPNIILLGMFLMHYIQRWVRVVSRGPLVDATLTWFLFVGHSYMLLS